MKDRFRLRTWAGPVTIGAFFVMAFTGILMFFHLNVGAVHPVHEWLGWLMIVGALAHLTVNWRPFAAYFRRPAAVAMMAVILLIGIISAVPNGARSHHGPPFLATLGALEQSPLTVIAQVAKCKPDMAVNSLRAHGFVVHDEQHTISEIATDSQRPSTEVLACIIGGAKD